MKNLFFTLILFISYISYGQSNIQIEYKYEGTDNKTEELLKDPNAILINFSYYQTKGNDTLYTFNKINDLRVKRAMEEQLKVAQPVKSFTIKKFTTGLYIIKPQQNSFLSVPEDNTLVKGEISEDLDWKISREKKKVLNFDVRKATVENDKAFVTAWYAPSLPFKIGPHIYHGLPGTILELKVEHKDESENIDHLIATDVQLSDDFSVSIPKAKNIYTKEEWDDIKKQRQASFQQMQGQGITRDE